MAKGSAAIQPTPREIRIIKKNTIRLEQTNLALAAQIVLLKQQFAAHRAEVLRIINGE